VCYVGCNANILNNDRIPEDQRVDVPDLPEEHNGGWEADDDGVSAAILAAAADAAAQAESFCDPPKCCEEWEVEIELLPGAAIDPALDARLRGLGRGHPNVQARERLRALDGQIQTGFCER